MSNCIFKKNGNWIDIETLRIQTLRMEASKIKVETVLLVYFLASVDLLKTTCTFQS